MSTVRTRTCEMSGRSSGFTLTMALTSSRKLSLYWPSSGKLKRPPMAAMAIEPPCSDCCVVSNGEVPYAMA